MHNVTIRLWALWCCTGLVLCPSKQTELQRSEQGNVLRFSIESTVGCSGFDVPPRTSKPQNPVKGRNSKSFENNLLVQGAQDLECRLIFTGFLLVLCLGLWCLPVPGDFLGSNVHGGRGKELLECDLQALGFCLWCFPGLCYNTVSCRAFSNFRAVV